MDSRFPSIEMLAARAKKRMPGFAYDYLTGGCFSDTNLARNTQDIQNVALKPHYLRDFNGASQKTTLFGKTYDSPFGIAPVGLQGLMWPKSCEILAAAAKLHNVPFCLSTVGTASIETIAKITEGDFWFQLYHPTDNKLRDKLIQRADQAGCNTLVLLADTPTFAYRPKEIRNGLSIPPKMTLSNLLQMTTHPQWSIAQLLAGTPEFKTMKPYIPHGLNMQHLGLFMNETFSGRLSLDKIKAIRDQWKGNLVIKGIVNPADAEIAIKLGVDGLIVSNHGGRQLDAGESSITSLSKLAQQFSDSVTLMMDGGIRSGADVASSLASGAKFTFLGRAPMFGACAMGDQGGNQVLEIFKRQLQQVMEQIGCERIDDLPKHLIK